MILFFRLQRRHIDSLQDLTHLYDLIWFPCSFLEKFFQMKKGQCKEALEIYKRFLTRMTRVSEFLKTAEVNYVFFVIIKCSVKLALVVHRLCHIISPFCPTASGNWQKRYSWTDAGKALFKLHFPPFRSIPHDANTLHVSTNNARQCCGVVLTCCMCLSLQISEIPAVLDNWKVVDLSWPLGQS